MTDVDARVIDVCARLEQVRARIAEACRRAGRDVSSVRLVAISKKQPLDSVRGVYEAGQRHFGENHVQNLEERKRSLPDDVVWHLVGHVQTNKAKRALSASLIHSVDTVRLGEALSRAALQVGARQEVLVEVNSAGEPSKSGVPLAEARTVIEGLRDLPGLEVRGLMCIPPEGEGRRYFAALRRLRDDLSGTTGLPLAELSMGMSDDFEDAIAEGATIVRVGTAIFGPRG